MTIQIDLAGPEGNAFALIGTARALAMGIAMTDDETDAVIKKMRSGDYTNLLNTLVDSFPGFDFEFDNDPRNPQ